MQAGEEWLEQNLVLVAGVLVGIAFMQVGRWNIQIKDRMIFDLVDLFNRDGFQLIKSNHSLTID